MAVQDTYTISKFVKFASWAGTPPDKKLLFKYLDVNTGTKWIQNIL